MLDDRSIVNDELLRTSQEMATVYLNVLTQRLAGRWKWKVNVPRFLTTHEAIKTYGRVRV